MAVTDLSQEAMLLKLAVPSGRGGGSACDGHLWVQLQERNGDRFLGVFENGPDFVPCHRGGAHRFGEDSISDWLYRDSDGMIRGAVTIRVMLTQLPPDIATDHRLHLAPLPAEG